MDETTLLLVPAPGAKPEFLATVEPTRGASSSSGDLPFEVVLAAYTRDAWATPPPSDSDAAAAAAAAEGWKSAWLLSVDGRGKLPGFLRYLRERKKVPFGRFDPASSSSDVGAAADGSKGVIVVPFEQPSPPENLLAAGSEVSVDDLIFVRYVLNENRIGRGYRKPMSKEQQQQQLQRRKQLAVQQRQQQQMQPKQQQQKAPPQAPAAQAKSSRSSSGMLGNLLGATRRTNTKLDTVPTRRPPSAGAGGGGGGAAASGSGAAIAKFRQEVEQKLLDFRSEVTLQCVKIPVSIAAVARDLPPEQKAAITMDVLKYVVYEQAEEIGHDKWVASKEASEFMDEAIIAVYKEGCAPAEVLEDLNQGEMPDEILQQQRAMRQARAREVGRKEAKEDKIRHQATVGSGAPDDAAWTLNTEKRDRRTIEEIQKEMESQKRQRTG